jgi:hypothetical protein
MKAKKKGKSKNRESRTQAPYGPAVGEELQALDALRRDRDGIAKAGDGFTIRDDGFSGTIYYRLGPRVLESAFEYWDPGKREIVVDPRGLRQWILPAIEPVSDEDQRRMESSLAGIVAERGGKVLFGELTRLYKNGTLVGMQGGPDSASTIRLFEPMSEQDLAKSQRQRRKKAGVPDLEQGFTNRSEGRTGMFYYREGDRILEFGWEFSGGEGPGEILISPDAFREWFHPAVEPIEADKQAQIKEAFIRMIRNQGGSPIFSPFIPSDISIAGTYGAES